jgi:hypothetical protein
MYVNSIGNAHIVGEVMNQAPIPAKFVKIIVTFYNAYNQVVGTDFTYTDFDTLYPGQRSPFDLIVLSSSVPLYLVRAYTLSVDWEPVQ